MMSLPNFPGRDGEVIVLGGEECLIYHGVSDPFVFTVVCVRKPSGVYLCEWFVSGISDPSPGEAPPVLLVNVVMGMKVARTNNERSELPEDLAQIWEERLRELAFYSAISGGIVIEPSKIKSYGSKTQKDLTDLHLASHDLLGHFSQPDKRTRGNLTLRTAYMYELLRSMGVTKIPNTISNFETWNFARFYEQIKQGADITVSVATVNQRIAHAKKLGLIEGSGTTKGRTPSAATVLRRGLTSERDSFLEERTETPIKDVGAMKSGTERSTKE